jgi:hypothetical protein
MESWPLVTDRMLRTHIVGAAYITKKRKPMHR